jgi:hypothetical protein
MLYIPFKATTFFSSFTKCFYQGSSSTTVSTSSTRSISTTVVEVNQCAKDSSQLTIANHLTPAKEFTIDGAYVPYDIIDHIPFIDEDDDVEYICKLWGQQY